MEMTMTTNEITVRRISLTSSRSFRDVVAAIDAAIGHPDMGLFAKNLVAAKTFAEVEKIVREATGPAELMEFTRMDLGAVMHKRNGPSAVQSLRLIVGNPVTMSSMVQFVPDAGSYAPVTILIDERDDGVHLSYDRMASYLATYGSSKALRVAEDLDAEVEAILVSAAG
jgi:hypothetical protein